MAVKALEQCCGGACRAVLCLGTCWDLRVVLGAHIGTCELYLSIGAMCRLKGGAQPCRQSSTCWHCNLTHNCTHVFEQLGCLRVNAVCLYSTLCTPTACAGDPRLLPPGWHVATAAGRAPVICRACRSCCCAMHQHRRPSAGDSNSSSRQVGRQCGWRQQQQQLGSRSTCAG